MVVSYRIHSHPCIYETDFTKVRRRSSVGDYVMSENGVTVNGGILGLLHAMRSCVYMRMRDHPWSMCGRLVPIMRH